MRSLTITKMLAPERATHRIRVTVVCPGAIETGIDDHAAKRGVEQAKGPVEFPAGRIPLTDGTPGTADAARHVTGTEVWIDGAQSLLVG